jgi:hypothetical protein
MEFCAHAWVKRLEHARVVQARNRTPHTWAGLEAKSRYPIVGHILVVALHVPQMGIRGSTCEVTGGEGSDNWTDLCCFVIARVSKEMVLVEGKDLWESAR